jgi:tetratricopeptide (TPR) repeat protein
MKNPILVILSVACASVLLAQEARKPEVVSPLGKSHFAKPADEKVTAAEKVLAEKPADPDRMIAAGRAYDAVLQFSRSIPLYTKVIKLLPNDVRAYRFRGHRYISTRRFKDALTDLTRAEKITPDSFDVLYHLALAQYLSGEFGPAADTYNRCLEYKGGKTANLPAEWRSCADLDDESRVAMMNWRYAALRRAGRTEDARKLLEGVRENQGIKENIAYLQALLFYRGDRKEDVFDSAKLTGSSAMALAYPIANFALISGDTAKACASFQKIVSDEENWAAFGFIAAETDLARRGGPCGKSR